MGIFWILGTGDLKSAVNFEIFSALIIFPYLNIR